MSEKRRTQANAAFEVGICKAENDIFKNHRLSKRSKSIELTNVDLNGVCDKYELSIAKCTTLPSLIKHIVFQMITSKTLDSYLGVNGHHYALGKIIFCLKFLYYFI